MFNLIFFLKGISYTVLEHLVFMAGIMDKTTLVTKKTSTFTFRLENYHSSTATLFVLANICLTLIKLNQPTTADVINRKLYDWQTATKLYGINIISFISLLDSVFSLVRVKYNSLWQLVICIRKRDSYSLNNSWLLVENQLAFTFPNLLSFYL